ncbi:MAG: hypothetical protein KDE27_00285 [Planctomycetes bacterium]|nr:hypothetical protein [Planctomycetota bacterium]
MPMFANTLTRALVIAATLFGSLPAQGDDLPKWKIDPYTKNDPEAMKAAGYVSFGPFDVGSVGPTPTTTTQIEEKLPYVRILWIETEHFKLGCALPAWTVPMELETRKKIRAELEELEKKLPNVKSKTRQLDPWLRAHLFAHRLEKLYVDVRDLFGVKDADFPADEGKVIRMPGAVYMGMGPYLGMKKKYIVLLFEKLETHQTYLGTFIGRNTKFPQRWHFKEVGSLMLSIAEGCDGGKLSDDTAMHSSVYFNTAQLLLDGFRYYTYDLPVWIREGFGHYWGRRASPKWNSFDQQEGGVADMKSTWKWEPYVRNLVITRDKIAPFSEVIQWRNFGDIQFNDHTAIWSRMDWLMSQGAEKWHKFVFAVKGRVDANWFPDQTDLVGATREALKDAYGLSVLNFDDRWVEWVKENYPSK